MENEIELKLLIGYKRDEEINRYGGIPCNLEIKNFFFLNDISFYYTKEFKNTLKKIHNIYVYDKMDFIKINEIKLTLENIYLIFKDLVTI